MVAYYISASFIKLNCLPTEDLNYFEDILHKNQLTFSRIETNSGIKNLFTADLPKYFPSSTVASYFNGNL